MRRSLLLNAMLAIVWVALTGSFTDTNFLVGLIVGYLIMRIVHPLIGTTRYIKRLWLIFELAAYLAREIFLASLRIAADVVTPSHRMQPGVIKIPLDVRTNGEITLLANLISLTPGTLSLDVSDDRRVLYIHVMYMRHRNVDAERNHIKRELERRVQAVFRPSD